MGTRYRDPKTPEQREQGRTWIVKVDHLMAASVMSITAHTTVERARELMKEHRVHALPVVDPEGRPAGIVSSADLLGELSAGKPVGQLMTRKVFTVPRYEDPAIAARIMRNHRIHHLIVTDEGRVVGILSSLDLLALIEERRFSFKQRPTGKARGGESRRRGEGSRGGEPPAQ